MNRLFLSIVFLLFGISAIAQDAASLFVMMPDDLLPQIEINRRKDLVDLARLNRKDRINNIFGEAVRINKMTDDFIEVQLSEISQFQIKRLPINDTTYIVALASTVAAPTQDSKIDFFDTHWKPLPKTTYLKEPTMDDFLTEEAKNQDKVYDEIKSLLEIPFLVYSFTDSTSELSVKSSVEQFLSEEDKSKLAPYLRSTPITYNWIKQQFALHNEKE